MTNYNLHNNVEMHTEFECLVSIPVYFKLIFWLGVIFTFISVFCLCSGVIMEITEGKAGQRVAGNEAEACGYD